MTDDAYEVTPSGVRLAKDFRNNLIIDRYDPVFVSMRPTKLKHLRSENSEDAITWNVFRSLRQISPTAWLRRLAESRIPGAGPDKGGADRRRALEECCPPTSTTPHWG